MWQGSLQTENSDTVDLKISPALRSSKLYRTVAVISPDFTLSKNDSPHLKRKWWGRMTSHLEYVRDQTSVQHRPWHKLIVNLSTQIKCSDLWTYRIMRPINDAALSAGPHEKTETSHGVTELSTNPSSDPSHMHHEICEVMNSRLYPHPTHQGSAQQDPPAWPFVQTHPSHPESLYLART